MKQIYIRMAAAVFAILIIFSGVSGCSMREDVFFDITSITSYREIPGITDKEIADIEALVNSNNRFIYGQMRETESFVLQDGTYAGFAAEFCELLSGLFGIDFTLELYDWADLINSLDHGMIDFTGELTKTAERMERYYMTHPIAERSMRIYILSEREEILDASGLVVGFFKNSVDSNYIKQNYPDLIFDVREVDRINDAAEMILSGEIDAFVAEGNLAILFDEYGGITSKDFFDVSYIPVSMTTAKPELEPIISVMDKYIAAGGMNVLYELYEKGDNEYARYAFLNSLSDNERAWLNSLTDSGTKIPIAWESNDYPICFYNEYVGEFQGIAVDILSEVSKITGIIFEAGDKDLSWPEVLNKLKTGEISLVTQLIYTAERAEHFIWTQNPYLTSHFAFISKEDIPNVKMSQVARTTVGIIENTAYAEMYNTWFIDDANVTYFNSQNEMLDALKHDEIELALGSENLLYALTHYREEPGYKANLLVPYPLEESYFGLNRNEVELCSIISKAMNLIDNDVISRAWTDRTYDYTRQVAAARTITFAVSAGGLFLLLGIVSFFLYQNNRRRKTISKQAILLSTIFNTLPDNICCKDVNGKYVSCNRSYEELIGRSEADIIGKTPDELYSQDMVFAKTTMEADRRILTGSPAETDEVWIESKDKGRRLYEVIKVPLTQNGQVTGLIELIRDITAHREVLEMTKELSDYEIMQYTLINKALDVALWDMDYTKTSSADSLSRIKWSEKLHYMLGYGKDLDYLDTLDNWEDLIHPDDKEEAVAAFEAHVQDYSGNTPFNVEYRLRTKDGSYRYFHAFGETLRGNGGVPLRAAGALEDITEKKWSQQAIENHQKTLENILNNINANIYVSVPGTGELLFVNNRMKSMFNMEGDGTGEYCYRVFRGLNEICDFCPCPQLDKESDKIIVWDEYFKQENYHIRHSDCYIDWPDGRKVHLQYAMDITELVVALEQAKESSRAKTEFLAKISHEIRTPMNVIIGMTELALRDEIEKPNAVKEHVFMVKRAAESLLALINDLLDFSKIEAGKFEIIPDNYSVASLINDIVSIIRMRVANTQIRFTVKVDKNIPHTLYGDELRIRQAVLNILNNAVKYTEKGFVSLGVYGEFTDEGTFSLIFEVSDSGIGIQPENIENLWNDFTQFDLERNRGIEGVGLGLAITYNTVTTMGGTVGVESEYGKGSIFTITLPQEYHSRDALAVVSEADKKSVLIYERRKKYAESLNYALECFGADVTVVENGTRLYEEMERRNFDYLFISYMLYMKNVETIKKFGKGMQIVALTEFGEEITGRGLHVLAMPTYCIFIADILNGVSSDFSYITDNEAIVSLSAPDAKILVVDDIYTNLVVAEGLLRPYNVCVDMCDNGKEAIEAIKSESYDLIFMDHKMPGMDGMEATRRIRELGENDKYYQEVPIIALTANAVTGMREMFLENGFNDFLSKPIDTDRLDTILEKWLPKHKKNKHF